MNRNLVLLLIFSLLVGCSTKGHLSYVTQSGELKTACETEYFGAPAVDQYAVEYILSYCAKKASKQGYDVVDKNLLSLDLSIPKPPNNKVWTFQLATQLHNKNQLTDKEYGYIIAYIDLNLKK